MNLFERIAIGTANFGKEYNGHKVSGKDVEKILGYCQSSGINTLDTATAYGWDWTQVNSFFKIVVKVRCGDDLDRVVETKPYCIMAHSIEDCYWMLNKLPLLNYANSFDITVTDPYLVGLSIYDLKDIAVLQSHWNEHPWNRLRITQLPYSLYDRRLEPYFGRKCAGKILYSRSIFLRGKIIEDGVPAEECIKFCLANPCIDKVIIGVDSVEQLQRNLDFLHYWQGLEKHDEELLDPRQWVDKEKP